MPRPYQHGLFSCGPCGLCMKATFCTCVVVGKNHHMIQHGTEQGYSTCNAWCWGWSLAACVGVPCILQTIDRSDSRHKYDLEGSGFGNFCTSWCCMCCESIQTSKEVQYQVLTQGGAPNGYMAHDKMQAIPQQ